jgi:hypothetical protein
VQQINVYSAYFVATTLRSEAPIFILKVDGHRASHRVSQYRAIFANKHLNPIHARYSLEFAQYQQLPSQIGLLPWQMVPISN